MSFDQIIDRRGSNCVKWDAMAYTAGGVMTDDAIAMWIADMDFAAPDFLQEATRGLLDKANYGYFTGEGEMKHAVAEWMKSRHGWIAEPRHMFSTYGLGNAIGICLQAFTERADEVIIFKTHDTDDHMARRVAHTAVDDPGCPAGTPTRASVEARLLALYT